MQQKPTIRIAIVDAGDSHNLAESCILPLLKDDYNFEITADLDADYVFHSCMGNEVLKYSGVRVFFTGECVSPDFNISDYALAFDPLKFADRHIRLPLIRFYTDAYASLCATRPAPPKVLASKTGFCAYVMSNTKNSAPEREALFEALNNYKTVDCGGKWRNNVGGPVADKIEFQSKYKFVLAVENAAYPGYLTEKFAHAAQSNAIPIYWGDPTITKHINPKAFINANDYSDFTALVDTVQALDTDDERYKAMLAEPWFIDGREPEEWTLDTYRNFLQNIFNQPHAQAYRRNLSRWGKKYENRYYYMAFRPHRQIATLAKRTLRRLKR